MAPSVTQPPRPPLPPATRTRAPSGRAPSGRAAQSLLFHPPSSPWPRGPAGAKELMPARSLPPPRLPPAFPVPVRAASSAFPAPRPEPGGPQVATITCKSSGARAPEGFYLLLPGSGSSAPGGSSSSCPCSPRPPSSNLTFRGGGGGGRGDPACAARAVGRRRLKEAAWSRGACGVRASGAPGAKLLAGAERNHGGKRGLERGSGLTTAAPGQGPALRLNRRRDAAAARLHSALRGAARLGSPGCSANWGGARRAGRGGARLKLSPDHGAASQAVRASWPSGRTWAG